MKKQLSIICSALMLGVIAQSAVASDGTINFVGAVTDSTCDITVNGTKGVATVNLPVVSTSLLKTPGQTAGRTFLTFELKNCKLATDKTMASIFYSASESINTAGRLDNAKTANSAKNVDLQILDSKFVAMNLSGDAKAQSVGALPVDIVNNIATIRNSVEYYATAQATAGAVTSSVQYEINYQ